MLGLLIAAAALALAGPPGAAAAEKPARGPSPPLTVVGSTPGNSGALRFELREQADGGVEIRFGAREGSSPWVEKLRAFDSFVAANLRRQWGPNPFRVTGWKTDPLCVHRSAWSVSNGDEPREICTHPERVRILRELEATVLSLMKGP